MGKKREHEEQAYGQKPVARVEGILWARGKGKNQFNQQETRVRGVVYAQEKQGKLYEQHELQGKGQDQEKKKQQEGDDI